MIQFRDKKNINFYLIILIVFQTILLSCENKMDEINALTHKSDSPQTIAENVETYYSSNAVIQGKLTAPLLHQYDTPEKQYIEFPKGVVALSYDAKNVVNASLSANYAKYDLRSKIWEYKDNVVLKNVNGDILKTELLFANETKEQLYTQKFVKIVSNDGSEISGHGGFESNLDFTDYQFRKVTGKMNFDEQ